MVQNKFYVYKKKDFKLLLVDDDEYKIHLMYIHEFVIFIFSISKLLINRI